MAVSTDPARIGRWDSTFPRFTHLPVHIALLHTGKVLAFGGSGNDPHFADHPFPAELFDPATGTVQEVEETPNGDVFCSGHAFLPDGRLLVAGGTYLYDGPTFPPFSGLDRSYVFDPASERWTRVSDLGNGRWYPTLLALGDGRVLAVAGLTKHFPWVFLREIEVFTANGGWTPLAHAARWMPLYPRLHLLPDGHVFYSGSYNTHYTFPFALWAFPTATLDPRTGMWRKIGTPHQSEREEGASVLLPLEPPAYRPRVLLIGGGTPGGQIATKSTELIDMGDAVPSWRPRDSMAFARYYAYAVTLPDGNILVLGGRNGKAIMSSEAMVPSMSASGEIAHDPAAVLTPELFYVSAETWTPLAPMQVDRMYHSNALLLPDGRVMMAGSNPARGVNELRIEIFHPPYLFRGSRPRIDAVPHRIHYRVEFRIDTSDAPDVDQVLLIHPSATTHCVDTEQRFVRLRVLAREAGSLRVQAPTNPFAAPAGYYLIFVARDGVPSVGRFVHLIPEQAS